MARKLKIMENDRETAGRLGVELRVLEADILAVPEVAANPADRCYYCKRPGAGKVFRATSPTDGNSRS